MQPENVMSSGNKIVSAYDQVEEVRRLFTEYVKIF